MFRNQVKGKEEKQRQKPTEFTLELLEKKEGPPASLISTQL